MSRQAIAAALVRDDLSAGERLVAFSLASFANAENRAWPGAPAAASRAGLKRSRYLEAREKLVRGGLVVVEDVATGRGGFGRERRSGSDTSRSGWGGNPGTNPVRNAGTRRAHEKEPQNPGTTTTPPQPP
jgi:hypothetical protein